MAKQPRLLGLERTSVVPWVLGLLWAVLVAAGLTLASSYRLLPEAPDKWSFDWRTLLLSERAREPRSDIAVITVGEDSLARYPHPSTIDRNLLAELVRALDAASPRAIGLDFFFDRATNPAADAHLVKAIREARAPVVLGALDRRAHRITDRQLAFQEDFITRSGRPAGHLFFLRHDQKLTQGDQVIRYIAGRSPPPARDSFAEALAALLGSTFQPSTPHIAWLLPPQQRGAEVFLTVRVAEHDPVDGTGVADLGLPADIRQHLKGRVVLVGGDFMDRDQHLTPLSVAGRNRTPGVIVHAHVLAQLLDKRTLHVLTWPWEFTAAFATALLGFATARRFQLHRFQLPVHLATAALLVLLGMLFFGAFRVIIPSTTVFFAWLAGIVGAQSADMILGRLKKHPRKEASTS